MTAARFVEMVERRRERREERTALQDALWFAAYRVAKDFYDGTSVKDLARIMIADGAALPSFRSLEDLQEWLDDQAETTDFGEDEEAYWDNQLVMWFS